MFKGFNIKYPEYAVITPQTLKEYTVRSLTVQEEEWLKGSALIASKISEHLNKCIWECIISKPKDVTSFEEFLEKTTTKDREALLYGIYHITYGDVRNYEVACTKCGKEHEVSIKISDAVNIRLWPDKKSVLDTIEAVTLPVSGIEVIIKQPTLKMEQDTISRYVFAKEEKLTEITEKLIIAKLIKRGEIRETEPVVSGDVLSDSTSDTPTVIQEDDVVVEDFDDILFAVSTLPARDRKFINKAYFDRFGQYGIELKMAAPCPKCGYVDEVDIDLVTQFFRMVFEDSI